MYPCLLVYQQLGTKQRCIPLSDDERGTLPCQTTSLISACTPLRGTNCKSGTQSKLNGYSDVINFVKLPLTLTIDDHSQAC